MRVKILNFGTNWWARFGRDPNDRYRFTRHAAYYNSTGVRCGSKMRRHWVVPGLIRFNCVGDFNPHLPNRSIGATFLCAGPEFACGGNRLLFGKKLPASVTPDCYLVVVSSEQNGQIDFRSNAWRSSPTSVIAASQLRHRQEALLLMKAGDWVRTERGLWQLKVSEGPRFRGGLELALDPIERGNRLP